MNKNKTLQIILIWISLIIVAVLGSIFVNLGMDWFNSLEKPSEWIPNIVIPIVWTIIYLIFYFTMIKFYDNSRIYNLYIIILIIQTLWNMVFFGLGSFLLALLIIITLYIVSWLFVYYLSKENKKYLYIYLIYIIWLLIATYLNIGIYVLN